MTTPGTLRVRSLATWILAAFLILLCPVVAARAADPVLGHDDGKRDDKRSTAGTGHVVAFDRPPAKGGDFTVTGVQVHGERYGGGFDPFYALARVSICDASLRVLAEAFAPYSLWKPGSAQWAEIPVGPCRVPERFHVVVEFFPTARRGVYLSVDAAAAGHSSSGSRDQPGRALEGGGWMVRVVGAKKPPVVDTPDPERTTRLERGEGEKIGERSTAGSGHAVLFKAPAKQRLLTQVSVFGRLYGGGYDPRTTLFHVFVCDKKLKLVARTAFPYAVFPSDESAWVDLDLPPVAVPRDFAVLVYFEPTASRGVYMGKWKESKAASLAGLPGKVHGKTDKGEGWMIRATVAASAGKQALPARADEGPADDDSDTDDSDTDDSGVDATVIADALARLDTLELAEDADAANALIEGIAKDAPEEADRMGRFHRTEHFLLRESGMDDVQVASLLNVMETAHAAIVKRFGFEQVGAVPGKRIHLRVTIDDGLGIKLFTNPGSGEFSQIVLRGPPRALRAPTHRGPHVVYGLCHEFGHVLIGWKDSEHQWAHYLGSVITSDVHAQLGDDGWWDPYDYGTLEGLPRLQREMTGAKPGLGDKRRMASLFHEIGKRYGEDVYGKAVPWIRTNREGEPFRAVRLYEIADLRAALAVITRDEDTLDELFAR